MILLYSLVSAGNNLLLYFILLSEIVSLYFLYKIWKGGDSWLLKFILSVVTLIPFLGPVCYLLGSDNTPRMQHQLNAGGRLFGRGRYTEWWSNEKPKLEKKIKELESEINEKEAKNSRLKNDP
jgi:hypothetical protein